MSEPIQPSTETQPQVGEVPAAASAAMPLPSPWKRRSPLIVGALIVVAVLGLVFGRSANNAVAVTGDTARSTPYLENGKITFSTQFAERIGFKSVQAEESLLSPSVEVTGRLTYDARLIASVGSRISGRVKSLLRIEGQEVGPGTVLAELESIELGRAQAEVLKARAQEQAATADATRERKLADAQISPIRDAEHAEATAAAAKAERIAAERAVLAMGGSVDGEPGVLQIRSPIKGRIVEASVARGQMVDPNLNAFVIADLSRLWVELDVYERDLTSVRMGDEVQVALQTRRDQKLKGRVAHIGDVVDAETHTAKVRVEIDNTSGGLRPGLAVVASIETKAPAATVLQVPREAVTRVDGKPVVFVALNDTSVEFRQVKLGLEDADSVAILDGVKPGEKVVTGGVFALKSEIFR